MESAEIVVRGRLHGKRIDLERSVEDMDGEVEVWVRPVSKSPPAVRLLDTVAKFPPGSRTKEDIDRQIASERDSWNARE